MRAQPTVRRGLTTDDDARLIAAIRPDETRYPVDKLEAHRRGLLHDAVSVFIFDGDEMLLQRRAPGKYHCGGLWANACCTHPDWGEAAEASASRRLGEELGVSIPLTEVGLTTYRADVGDGLVEHERVRVFRSDVDRDALQFALNPAEVSEIRWAGLAALQREAAESPERFAPWLRIYLSRWDTLGLS